VAIKNHTEGTVVLTVVVGADGKAHDIVVVKPLPDGLTEKAIEAVQSWRFNPAKGPDGNPAAVREMIEVKFRPYISNWRAK
jgi:TonB family protein